mmetsp:Transcript_6605/g.13764  ORF Transcript_6605/g.13764 Transcript_6605/m.13764 type:complete len:226 (+) Transcript_6605:353-1030(+)
MPLPNRLALPQPHLLSAPWSRLFDPSPRLPLECLQTSAAHHIAYSSIAPSRHRHLAWGLPCLRRLTSVRHLPHTCPRVNLGYPPLPSAPRQRRRFRPVLVEFLGPRCPAVPRYLDQQAGCCPPCHPEHHEGFLHLSHHLLRQARLEALLACLCPPDFVGLNLCGGCLRTRFQAALLLRPLPPPPRLGFLLDHPFHHRRISLEAYPAHCSLVTFPASSSAVHSPPP